MHGFGPRTRRFRSVAGAGGGVGASAGAEQLQQRQAADGLHKPKREPRSLRERSGKPPGGQKGHKGETLRRVDAPEHTVEHYPEACPACGSALSATMSTGYGARQVFDLPEPLPLAVTEHHLPVRALRAADAG